MHLRSVAISAALIAVILAAVLLPSAVAAVPEPSTDRPHIVIIGIDSLRSDLSLPKRGDGRRAELSAIS